MKNTGNMIFTLLAPLVLNSVSVVFLNAQAIRHYFDDTETRYVGFAASGQVWGRYTRLNPGSVVNGREQESAYDLTIRRYRMKIYGQYSSKIAYTLSFGNNNLNAAKKEHGAPKLLDAYATFNWNKSISVGMGKSAWTGLSRYAAPATSSALGADIQFIAMPFINYADDLLRKLSVFVAGQKGKLDYRVALAKPYVPSRVSSLTEEVAQIAPYASDYQLSSYVKLQFRDRETQKSPFVAATYLGDKDILNIGIGMFYQPKATCSLVNTDTSYYSARSFAVDLFYEHPVLQKTVLTFYTAYFHHELGPNFVRQVGANNPAEDYSTSAFINGKGNSALVTGTGHIYFFQGGVLRRFNRKGIQVYGSCANSSLEALDRSITQWETGINYLLDGHRSKFTLGYQNWPLVKKVNDQGSVHERRYAIIVQYQFKIG